VAALQRHEAATRAANETRAKLDDAERRAAEERSAHAARVAAAADATVARLQRDVADARRAANERRTQCETLLAQAVETKRALADAEHEVRQLQQRVDESQAAVQEARAAADDADARHAALRADMDALRNRTAAAERRATRAESACDQLRDRIAALSGPTSLDGSGALSAGMSPSRFGAMRERLRDVEAERDALRQRCEAAEARVSELEANRPPKSEATLQNKLLSAQQRCEALQVRNETLQKERDELERQLTGTVSLRPIARATTAAAAAAVSSSSRAATTAAIAAIPTYFNDAGNDGVCVDGDEIERQVQALLKEHAAHDIGAQLPANFHRISAGVYQFGTRKVYLQLRNGALMARVGGGFVKLLDFIDRHGPQERVRLRRLASQYGDALASANSVATATTPTTNKWTKV
jgi:predicted nuclease with TOPRIM domain